MSVAFLRAAVERVQSLRHANMTIEANDAALQSLCSLNEGGELALCGELLEALSNIYDSGATNWAELYPSVSREIAVRSEQYGGRPPLAGAFERAADELILQGRRDDAFRHLCASATVYAEFACTGFPRQALLKALWNLAIELDRRDVALAAARAYLGLTEPDDVFMDSAQYMMGVALFKDGNSAAAIPYFEWVVEHRRALDAKRDPTAASAATRDAEEWLARAITANALAEK